MTPALTAGVLEELVGMGIDCERARAGTDWDTANLDVRLGAKERRKGWWKVMVSWRRRRGPRWCPGAMLSGAQYLREGLWIGSQEAEVAECEGAFECARGGRSSSMGRWVP